MISKIRLVNGTEYEVKNVKIVDGHLEIGFTDKTSEEIQHIFQNESTNLQEISLYTEDGKLFGTLSNWTKYAGVYLNGKVSFLLLIQTVDPIEQRITKAEATAIEAKQIVENQTTTFSLIKNAATISAQTFSDEEALSIKYLYPTFDELVESKYTAKSVGYKFTDGDDLYKTAQPNLTFQAQYRPGQGMESLYTHIDETHTGTKDDPIPAVANMEYFQNKYYIENGIVYLCNSELAKNGVVLQYTPSQLIGNYFVVAEE